MRSLFDNDNINKKMSKKLTYQEIYKRFKDEGYELLDTEYLATGKPLLCRDNYGFKYKFRPNSLRRGSKATPFDPKNPYSIDNMRIFFQKESNGSQLLCNEYINSKMNIEYTCEKCGKIETIKWSSILKNKNFKCVRCTYNENSKNKTHTTEYIKEYFKNSGYIMTDEKYIKNNQRINCVDINGYKIKTSYSNLSLYKNPYKFSIKFNSENYIFNINNYFKINNINCKALYYKKDEFIGEYNTVKCICECGREFNSCWGSIKDGKTRCPKCSSKMSNIEKKVSDWLDFNNINYEVQKTFDNLKSKRDLRFDFYLIDYNCCIEVDGIQHEKPVIFSYDMDELETFKRLKRHDKMKDDYCCKNGIELIRISQRQIESKEKEYIEILSNKLIKK